MVGLNDIIIIISVYHHQMAGSRPFKARCPISTAVNSHCCPSVHDGAGGGAWSEPYVTTQGCVSISTTDCLTGRLTILLWPNSMGRWSVAWSDSLSCSLKQALGKWGEQTGFIAKSVVIILIRVVVGNFLLIVNFVYFKDPAKTNILRPQCQDGRHEP